MYLQPTPQLPMGEQTRWRGETKPPRSPIRLAIASLGLLAMISCSNKDSNSNGTALVTGGSAHCLSIEGGVARGSTQCAGCTLSSPTNASDANLNSYAEAQATSGSQSLMVTIRSVAKTGTVFSAGSNPGAFVTQITGVASGGQSNTVNTYLNGVLQDSSSSGINSSSTSGTAAQMYYSVTATKPFDAVEIVGTANFGQNNSCPDYKVFEICGDGGS